MASLLAGGENPGSKTIVIPNECCGRIIGKGGAMIKQLAVRIRPLPSTLNPYNGRS